MKFTKAIDPKKSLSGKVLAVFVALVMVVSMCPMPGFAKAVAADTDAEGALLEATDLPGTDNAEGVEGDSEPASGGGVVFITPGEDPDVPGGTTQLGVLEGVVDITYEDPDRPGLDVSSGDVAILDDPEGPDLPVITPLTPEDISGLLGAGDNEGDGNRGPDDPQPLTSTVTFTADGEVVDTFGVADGVAIGDSLPAGPDKPGYRFVGWFEGDQEITAETVVYQAINAEARYVQIFTVQFYGRNADPVDEPYKSFTVDAGEALGDQCPAPIPHDDYDTYWVVATIVPGDQGPEFSPTETRVDSTYVPTADTIVVFGEDKITYTVRFFASEDAIGGAPLYERTVDVDTTYCLNDIPQVPTQTGAHGTWVYSNGPFSNTVHVNEVVATGRTLDVWAEYEQTVFTVKFMVDNKVYETDTYYTGDTLTLPAAPVVEGKEFTGWFVGETQIVGGEAVTSDMTIVAAFENEYEVRFIVYEEDGVTEIERLSQYFKVTEGEPITTMPQDPFVAGRIFEKWVNKDTGAEVTAATVVTGPITAVAQFREVTVYSITVKYFYKNDQSTVFVFNTELLQVEADELPYTITAPSTTQTAADQVAGAPIYYASPTSQTVQLADFDAEHKTTVEFEYVPYTALYDISYVVKDLTGEGYTEIERVQDVHGVLNAYVTPEVKDYPNYVLELAEGAIIETSGMGGQPKQVFLVKYVRKNFTLSYETNGGSYVAGGTYPYGSNVSVASSNPTRAGYTFGGWYLDEGLTQPAGNSVTIEGNTTLYAKWTGAQVGYTIVYMLEEYNNDTNTTSYVYDNSRAATGTVGSTVYASSAPALTGNKYRGYEADTAFNATSSATIAADGSSVLVVHYKLIRYTLVFNINRNDGRITMNGETYTGSNYRVVDVVLGQDVSSMWPAMSTEIYDRYGARYFEYWTGGVDSNYVTKRYELIYDNVGNADSNHVVTYTAQWSRDSADRDAQYWLQQPDGTYKKEDAYTQIGLNTTNLGQKDIDGYSKHSGIPNGYPRSGRYDDNNQSTGTWGKYTYRFYYDRAQYQIDYFYGNTRLKTEANIYFEADITGTRYTQAPTAAQCGVDSDYTFDGWYEDAAFQTKYVFGTMPGHNVALYAKWVAPSYTVTFVDGDEPTTQLADSQTVAKYEKATRPGADPTKAGYVFDGWYSTATGDQLFDWNTQITADTVVYAQWGRATLSYVVHYVDENGDSVAPDKNVTDPTLMIGQSVSEQAISVAGYRPKTNSETIVMKAEDNVITIVYTAKAEVTGYTVKYIIASDEPVGAGVEVVAPKTVNDVPGDTASVIELAAGINYDALYEDHPELAGMEFFPDEVEKTLVLLSDPADNVLTFYYSSFKSCKVTVNYVDMKSAAIARQTVETYKVGKTFTLSRTPIEGWELFKAVEGTSISGTEAGSSYKITEAVTASGLTFTVFYQKKATITAASDSKQYDGTPLLMPTALADQVTVEGLLDGHELTGIGLSYSGNDVAGGRQNVGIATVTPGSAVIGKTAGGTVDSDYYKIRYISGALEVTPIYVTVRIEPDRWTGAPYTGEPYYTGFTNPGKVSANGADYIMISHEGYAETYLAEIWAGLTAASVSGSDLTQVTKISGGAGLGYAAISQKDAGDYTYQVLYTVADLPNDPNYSVSLYVRDGRLQILPAELTVTTGSATKPYDGTALTNEEATLEGLVAADEGKVTVAATGSQTEVGSSKNFYEITWGDVNPNNYIITDELGTLEVTPAEITVVVKDKTVPYNGEEQEGYTIATVTGTGSEVSTDDYTVTGLANGDVLTVTYQPAKGTNAGTYENGAFETDGEAGTIVFTVTKGETDVTTSYTVKTATAGKLIITPLEVTLTGASADPITYDGEAHTVEGYTSSVEGLTFPDTVKASGTGTAVGEYDVTFEGLVIGTTTDTTGNYVVTAANPGSFEIVKAKITITVTGNTDTKVYNASEQSVTGYSMSCDDPLYSADKVSGPTQAEAIAKGTNVGEYPMGLSDSQFAYNDPNVDATFSVTDGKLTITKATVEITVEGNTDSKVYNASEQSVTGYTVSSTSELFNPDYVSGPAQDAAIAKGTNVGTYPMGLTKDDFSYTDTNVDATFTVTDGELEITKASITITVTGNTDTKVYNAEEQSVEGYNISSTDDLYDASKVTFSGTDVAKGTNVGNYPMGLADTQFGYNDDNVDATFQVTDGELEITKASITITVEGHKASVVYSGSEQSVEGYDISSSDALYDATKVNFSGEAVAKGTNAGTYPMGLTDAQFSYTDDNVDATFNVTDGQLVISADELVVIITGNKDTKVFNGGEQEVTGYTVTIPQGADFTEADIVFSGTDVAKGTNVGTYDMGLAANQFSVESDNFDVTFQVTDGSLEITPLEVTVTITGNKDSYLYNGGNQSVTGYQVEISDPLYTEADFTFSGDATATRTDVGTTPMGLAQSQFTNTNDNFNVTFNVTDGQVEITPLAVTVTITGNTDEKVYNGGEQQVEGYTVVDISDPLYTEADFTFSGDATATRTDVGTTPMGLLEEQFTNTNDNFTVTFQVTDGKITITPLEVTVTITGNTDTKVFNGGEQQVEGYTVDISDPLYTEADFTFSGEAIAKGTDVDTYPMGLAQGQFANTNDNFNVTFSVTDGSLEITPLTVTVTITGNTDSKVYNGGEQKVEGYTVDISDPLYTEADFVFSGEAIAKGTDVNIYDMGLTEPQFTNTSNNFTVTFIVTDGSLEITPLAVTVTITGNRDSKVYNGEEQSVEGYEVGISDPLYTEADFTFSGEAIAKGTNVNTYDMGLAEGQFANTNDNFDVTFSVTDGSLEITPLTVTITITGNTDSQTYNGSEQSVEGYEATASSDLVDVTKVVLVDAVAIAKGTHVAGSPYAMGLESTMFIYDDPNFDVTFEVTDGQLEITPKDVTFKSGDKEKVWDGTELTYHYITADGLIDGEDVRVTFSGTITDPGEAPNTYTLEWAAEPTAGKSAAGRSLFGMIFGGKTADAAVGEDLTPTAIKSDYNVTEETGTLKITTDGLEAILDITKEVTNDPANGKFFKKDEVITFKVTITNNGTVPLKDVVVKDELTGDEFTVAELAVGATEEFEVSWTVTADDVKAKKVENVATATGKSAVEGVDDPAEVQATATATCGEDTIPYTGDGAMGGMAGLFGAMIAAAGAMFFARRRMGREE